MVIFVSSTFRDLKKEREALQDALREGEAVPWGMEFFNSQPEKPLDVCLNEIGQSGAVFLVIGFRGGSLIPENDRLTYTAAEIHEAKRLGLPIFLFIKTENGSWRNEEPAGAIHDALDIFKRTVEADVTPVYFDTLPDLKFKALASVKKWTEKGRPGARTTFASREEFFAPYAQPTTKARLFDFRQELEGRQRELENLNDFSRSSDQLVAILPGRGGIGKTKLLHDWTADVPGFHVVFVRNGAVLHRESDKELPTGDVLIIADDAHREQHLRELLGCVQNLAQHSGRRLKLLLSSRPSGVPAIRAALSRFYEPSQIRNLPNLEKLSTEEVRRLATQLLGSDYAHLRDWLVSLSGDTPLVTVVGARLISRGVLENPALANEAEFRSAVFDRFIEDYTTALPKEGFPWRKLIDVIAAVGPARARSDKFLSATEKFLGVPAHDLAQGIDQLEAHGLLIYSDNRLGIAPDTLADFLLEGACINSRGEPTGYAEAVFREYSSQELPSLLGNFAELEWRLEQKANSGRVLQPIWHTIQQNFRNADSADRIEMLEALEGAAVFQPNPTFEIVRTAMDTEAAPGLVAGYFPSNQLDVFARLPRLLESLAYHEEHTGEAVRRLFKLSKLSPESGAGSRSPQKALVSLASVQMHKPVAFLSVIGDIASTIAREPDAFTGPVTPLDIADVLPEREIQHTESTETEIRIASLALNYGVAAPIRESALQMIHDALKSDVARNHNRAVQSLTRLLSAFLPMAGRRLTDREREWQDAERLRVLDIINSRICQSGTQMPLLRQIRHILRQCPPSHHSDAFVERLRHVQAAIPDSEELSSFDAFCTPEWDSGIHIHDLSERSAQFQSQLEAAVAVFRNVHKSPHDQLKALERMAQEAVEYNIETGESAYLFVEIMCRHADFLLVFIEYALGNPHPRLGFQVRAALPQIRALAPSLYAPIGVRLGAHPQHSVAIGTANAVCYGPQLESPTAGDASILSELAKHSNPHVRKMAIDGAARLGHVAAFQNEATEIISRMDLAGDAILASAVCHAFGPGGLPVTLLSRGQIEAILTQLLAVHRLDDGEHHVFLSRLAQNAPDLLFDFLLARLRRFAEFRSQPENRYRHWGNSLPRTYFEGAQLPDRIADQLREVRGLMALGTVPSTWIKELFWAFGEAGGAARITINEWLESGDTNKMAVAHQLGEGAPHEDSGVSERHGRPPAAPGS